MTEDSLRPTVAEQDPLVPLAGRHAVILWAVIAVIVLSVKALIEVRFNVELALAIAQGTGPEKVLIGLLVAFLPYLVLAGAAVGLEVAWRYHWPPFTTALSIGLWLVVAVLTPIWSVVVLLVGALVALIAVRRGARMPGDWIRGGDTMNAAGITPAAFMSGLASGGRGPALDQSAPPSVASRGDGRSRTRRRSWALAATTMVETLMAIAPTAIGRSMPQGMSRPAATGMARTL